MNLLNRICYYPFGIKIRTILLYKWRLMRCGAKVFIDKPLKMSFKYISLGDNVYIWRNSRIEAVTRYAGVCFYPKIILGNNVTIQQNLHLTCAKCIEIGANTAIAANVTITDINHQYTDINIPIEQQLLDISSIKIGEDCKIYNNVVLLPGTIIGKHCVVGANSVVSGLFDDYCIIVGAPAKVVKRYNDLTNKWEKTNYRI